MPVQALPGCCSSMSPGQTGLTMTGSRSLWAEMPRVMSHRMLTSMRAMSGFRLVRSSALLAAGGGGGGTLRGDLGITATASEINHLDGITSTVTELNYADGVTSAIQTQLDGKV